MKDIQRATTDRAAVLFRQLHGFTENVRPVACRRNQHARFQIGLDQTARRRHLIRRCIPQEEFEMKRVHKLQFVKRRIADGLPLNVRDDFCAVRLRIVEFNEAARVQIGHCWPPRASETNSLSGLPGGCSPQTFFARARKSGWLAGTTLAMTFSFSVSSTSSPAATHSKISAHFCGSC